MRRSLAAFVGTLGPSMPSSGTQMAAASRLGERTAMFGYTILTASTWAGSSEMVLGKKVFVLVVGRWTAAAFEEAASAFRVLAAWA